MSDQVIHGKWFQVSSEGEYRNLLRCGQLEYDSRRSCRVMKGEYQGSGWYMLLSYSQRCPRNCCYDHVYEVLSVSEVIERAKDEIRDYAEVLKLARQKGGA